MTRVVVIYMEETNLEARYDLNSCIFQSTNTIGTGNKYSMLNMRIQQRRTNRVKRGAERKYLPVRRKRVSLITSNESKIVNKRVIDHVIDTTRWKCLPLVEITACTQLLTVSLGHECHGSNYRV